VPPKPAVRRLVVIGIGAGDPGLLTLDAVVALGAVDRVFLLDKGEELDELAALRREVLSRHARPDLEVVTVPDPPRILDGGDYEAAVAGWHTERVAALGDAVVDALDDGGTGGFLVWGDPSLYDSTLRILDDLRLRLPWPVELEVLPGISSLHLLTARHAIPLNRVGAEVRITTGRRLLDAPPTRECDVAVFLDAHCRFAELPDDHLDLYWGAYLGTADELLIAGPLAECKDIVIAQRAAARSSKGWMFDTYLLRWRG
jgi:precorrin-6A synthase